MILMTITNTFTNDISKTVLQLIKRNELALENYGKFSSLSINVVLNKFPMELTTCKSSSPGTFVGSSRDSSLPSSCGSHCSVIWVDELTVNILKRKFY